ncbi:hypothetical protein EUGRSUZ_I00146 [Eucalyptus grandis]|uniref:Uncharacterized protein n=2 Tax=Eucalyptus grandis TaxID=71139 RepID=A0ACC3JBL2_EUCGR|nr:hypothetical protein EUGRSUZ_I00146 [Eucalyptus grandis]
MSSSNSDDDPAPKLPRDVVVDILKWLLVRSLLRFRCICQSWRSTIEDPCFVALHLNHPTLNTSNQYLASLERSGPLWRPCSLFSNDSIILPRKSQFDILLATPSNSYTLVGSCNGLICFKEGPGYFDSWSIHIWIRFFLINKLFILIIFYNLFTKKHKAVPRFGLHSIFLSMYTALAIGFGFHAMSNDHKILMILHSFDDNRQYLETRVQIYSLSIDSWRSLECEVPTFCSNAPSVFLNGNLHWFLSKRNERYVSIVLLDVADEVFGEMVPRKEFLHSVSVSSQVVLSVLNDLLVVCTIHGEVLGHPQPLSICSVWVIREYGKPQSWTELYSFETSV